MSDLQWGFRIDGTDLRVHAAEATRDLWRAEANASLRSPVACGDASDVVLVAAAQTPASRCPL
ncbi:hypothetical protein ACE1SV_63120 [Streptomyces sp. E-15]